MDTDVIITDLNHEKHLIYFYTLTLIKVKVKFREKKKLFSSMKDL